MPSGVAVVFASMAKNAAAGSFQMVIAFGQDIRANALPISAGLKTLKPRPPKSCLVITIATNDAMIGTWIVNGENDQREAGMFMPRSRPVRKALPSLTTDFLPTIFMYQLLRDHTADDTERGDEDRLETEEINAGKHGRHKRYAHGPHDAARGLVAPYMGTYRYDQLFFFRCLHLYLLTALPWISLICTSWTIGLFDGQTYAQEPHSKQSNRLYSFASS